ncbi:hypothetical protein E3E22_02780 [Thermococcus sp. MV5]|uniref:hypothetical protein n=1 Tax=Thermococcus sp. MV5 TaxID=1638272 RepID=UPI001439D6AE|nr:hypothetical protein [Thermococcus sp. MV5]NJE25562.1 hypothetical protein [Thermococcus sp. MV5]
MVTVKKCLALLLIGVLVFSVISSGCIGGTKTPEKSNSPTASSTISPSSTLTNIQSFTTSTTPQGTFAIEISGLIKSEISLEELEALGGVEFNATLVKSTGAKINNTYMSVPLAKVFEKVGVDKSKIKWIKLIVYENGEFKIPELGIEGLKGIRVDRG